MFVDALAAYLYAYDNGVASFPDDWQITHNFTWQEAFTNETRIDGYPILEVFKNVEETAKVAQKIRAKLKRPMIIHCWVRQIPHNKRSGSSAKRSPHINGRAIDFHVNGLADSEVRKKILELNLPVRIEDGTTGWVHIDIGNSYTEDYNWGLFK